ncbi:hypothetical protein JCM24511_02480 [Saitozyma sp. JCM 24511]|nr:hypothetical protein JCM24511_02480 [Saitozyma sp. JCM 24511]
MPSITAQSKSSRLAAQIAQSRRDRASDADIDKWPTNSMNTMSNGSGGRDDQNDDGGRSSESPGCSEVKESGFDVPTAISSLALDDVPPGFDMTTTSLIFMHTDWSYRSDEPGGERKCNAVIWPMTIESAADIFGPQILESIKAGAGLGDEYQQVVEDLKAVQAFTAVWKPEWDEALDPELIGMLRKACVTRTKAMSDSYHSLEGYKSPVSIVSRSEWRRRADPNEVYLGNLHNTAESDRGIRYTIAQHDDGMGHTLSVSWESAVGWDDEEGDVLVSEPGDAFTVVRFKQEPINGAGRGFVSIFAEVGEK